MTCDDPPPSEHSLPPAAGEHTSAAHISSRSLHRHSRTITIWSVTCHPLADCDRYCSPCRLTRLSEPMAIQQVKRPAISDKIDLAKWLMPSNGSTCTGAHHSYGLGDKCAPMPRGGAMLGGPSSDPPITSQKYANFIKSNVKTRFLVIC